MLSTVIGLTIAVQLKSSSLSQTISVALDNSDIPEEKELL